MFTCRVLDPDLPKMSSDIENEDRIPPSAVIAIVACDPCASVEKKAELVSEETSTIKLDSLREDEDEEHAGLAAMSKKNVKLLPTSLSKLEGKGDLSVGVDLWDASKGIHPPLEENILEKDIIRSWCLFVLEIPT